jgi:FixJ family two-component response regulator
MERQVSGVVYLVDHDLAVLNDLRQWLRSAQLTLRAFRTAEQFLAEYQHPDPGCLIVEHRLSGLSGLELQAELQARNSPLAVILIAHTTSVSDVVRAMQAGAVTFLQKPLDHTDLQTAILQALKRSWDDCTVVQARQSEFEILSNREREVVDLLLDGLSTKQISQTLQISTSTVHKHRIRIFSKLRVDSPTDLLLKSAHFSSRLGRQV